MKRFFHTLVTLLLLAACTDGNNELGSKDPFSIPDKEGCNVKGTVFDDYGTPLEGIVVSDGLQTTQTDRNGHFWLSSDLSKRRFVTVTVPSGYEIESKEAKQCYGVAAMAPRDMTDAVKSMVYGSDYPEKGVRVTQQNGRLVIELHIAVSYGLNISTAARSISHRVKDEVEQATGLKVARVVVSVDDVIA